MTYYHIRYNCPIFSDEFNDLTIVKRNFMCFNNEKDYELCGLYSSSKTVYNNNYCNIYVDINKLNLNNVYLDPTSLGILKILINENRSEKIKNILSHE
jgi:hypothetical protein